MAAAGLALGLVLGSTGCALLVPPSWRAGAPVPLAGPIPNGNPEDPDAATRLARMSEAELEQQVADDQARLVEIASSEATAPHASPEALAELRAIGARLPGMQQELRDRGAAVEGEGARIRHPVIR